MQDLRWLYKSMGTDGRIDIITDEGILGINAGPFQQRKITLNKYSHST
jgi:hypothetical protein